MTPATADHLAILAQQRAELDAERRRIEQAHCLAVLDHITARIRALCPEAAYVEFAYDGKRRTLDLSAVLGKQTSPLELWDGSDKQHPLAEISDAIRLDVQSALAPYRSPAWAQVWRNKASEGNSWLLELPPTDRVARIAQLVHEHHPEATAVIVDGRSAGGRIIEVVEGSAEDGTQNLTTRRRWPSVCDEVLTRLVVQVFAIPALAGRYLTPLHDYRHPYGTSSDLVRLMSLPPTA